MDGRAWWATVHGVTKSQTWLSELTSLPLFWSSGQKYLFVYSTLILPVTLHLVQSSKKTKVGGWEGIALPSLDDRLSTGEESSPHLEF